MPSAISGAIGLGGGILSGILGSNAASSAGQQIAAGYGKATTAEQAASQQAASQQQAATAQIGQELNPYTSAGAGSTNYLAQLLQPGGALTQGYGSFTAPTAQQAQNQPGYQFQLQQGLNALQNSAAASGGLLSTGTAKNLENYAQGVASTNYNNVYNQALQAYQTNASNYYTGQNNLYGRLQGLTNTGLSASGQLTGLQQQGANALNQNYLMTGQLAGQNAIGAAQGLAAGTIGSANSLAGMLGGASTALQGGFGNLDTTGGSSFGEQIGNFFSGL